MSKVLLLVEDDPLMLRMYEKIFKFEGFELNTAKDGEEGWEKVQSLKPVLVLLDIMMPKVNGLEMLAKLKSDPDAKDIPVVILTNLANPQEAEKAKDLGAVKYLVKSEHDPKEVVTLVKQILAENFREDIPES